VHNANKPIPSLDGFRAIAILIVMGSHVGLSHFLPGQFGVTLFFFLSGYLITTLLRREISANGRINLSAFYLRRVVRILPPMYITICFVALLAMAGLIRPINFNGLAFDFLFLTNYFPVSGIQIGLWSLAVEEHYYMIFPLLLALLARNFSFKSCAFLCVLLCGFGLMLRFWEVSRLDDFSQVNFWSHTRIDSILFGSVLALWNNPVADKDDQLPRRWASYCLGGLLLLSTFLIRDEWFRQTLRYTLQGFGLILIFNAAIRDTVFARPILDNAVTRFIALHSYTLYLVHVALIALCIPLIPYIGLKLATLFGIILSFIFAMLMHRYVEKPLGVWRRQRELKIRTPAMLSAKP
jgi:peptidoglycan/LPS O-acetylase OafA/YrhL